MEDDEVSLYNRKNNIELPSTVSYLTSNLSLIRTNDKIYVGIIHKGEFVIICITDENAVVNRVVPKLSPQQMVLQGSWIWTENPLLILTTTTAVQIFDWDGAILLHTYHSKSPANVCGASAHRGIIGLPSGRICIGVQSGEILILNLKDSDNLAFVEEAKLKWFSNAIVALASKSKTVIAGDSQGNIVVGYDDHNLEKKLIIEPYGKEPSITCIEILGEEMIVGYMSGHIRIFSILTGVIRAEVNAHARSILSLDIATSSGTFISAAEDSFVRVWRIDVTSKTLIEHKFSECVRNSILTGCRFVDVNGTEFLLSAYDASHLYHFAMQ